jgi:predicted nuclease of predicted toxin-antitoxin system
MRDVYPGASHVRDFALQQADDEVVWEFARNNGFTITSKDSDFHHLSFVRGAPPRVIWLDLGNCSTEEIEDVLRANVVRVIAFHRDPDSAFLVLRRSSP